MSARRVGRLRLSLLGLGGIAFRARRRARQAKVAVVAFGVALGGLAVAGSEWWVAGRTGSAALRADALLAVSNVVSTVLIAVALLRKRRVAPRSTLVLAVAMALTAGVILADAVARTVSPGPPPQDLGWIMLTGIAAAVAQAVAGWVLYVRSARAGTAVRRTGGLHASWDASTSLLVAAAAAWQWGGVTPRLDAVVAAFIAVVIAYSAWRIGRPALRSLRIAARSVQPPDQGKDIP